MKLRPSLLLIRPANVITAIADVVAGIAIVGFLSLDTINSQLVIKMILLCLSTAGLYAGGIIFNDVFDVKSDQIHRPERVIPSGKLSLKQAKTLGIWLFTVAIIFAFCATIFSGIIAVLIMSSALLYDKYGKHNTYLGPINMGLCRGLNLILGMSIMPNLEFKYMFIGILPILFISAITLTAQKETKGKNKGAIGVAMLLDVLIILGFVFIATYFNFSIKNAALFLVVWYGANTIAKARAIVNNNPKLIMNAVKIGILSLIPLNASYVAGFSSIYFALGTLCLLPISLFLSKKFPVT